MERGRPTKYDPVNSPRIAAKVASMGGTLPDIAEALGVNLLTVSRWQNQYEDFCKAIKLNKEEGDKHVEKSLYQRAKGYFIDTEKVFCNDGVVTRVPVKEYIPPDPAAARYWLNNRKPKEWRNRKEIEHSGVIQQAMIGIPADIDKVTGQSVDDGGK